MRSEHRWPGRVISSCLFKTIATLSIFQSGIKSFQGIGKGFLGSQQPVVVVGQLLSLNFPPLPKLSQFGIL